VSKQKNDKHKPERIAKFRFVKTRKKGLISATQQIREANIFHYPNHLLWATTVPRIAQENDRSGHCLTQRQVRLTQKDR
jgi:hypothetical protein